MNRRWVQIRSWHIVKSSEWQSQLPGSTVTYERSLALCGRISGGVTWDQLPSGKSCETCLRIAARQDDH